MTSGSTSTSAAAHSGTSAPASSASTTSLAARSHRRRNGAVTWAYGAATAAWPGSSGALPSTNPA